jgi:hypothetical protein
MKEEVDLVNNQEEETEIFEKEFWAVTGTGIEKKRDTSYK